MQGFNYWGVRFEPVENRLVGKCDKNEIAIHQTKKGKYYVVYANFSHSLYRFLKRTQRGYSVSGGGCAYFKTAYEAAEAAVEHNKYVARTIIN